MGEEVKSKFEEVEKIEINKLLDDAEDRIKILEESKIDSKALLHEVSLQLKEEETKLRTLDHKYHEHEAFLKNLQDFKIRGATESRVKDLEDFKVKEIARKEAETESKRKGDEDEKIKKAESFSEEDSKLKALGARIAEEESRVRKLEENRIKEDAEINELKIKLVEKEGRIKALEDFRVKEEARRKAEKETREKAEKKRSEETQRYFAMIGILVTSATSFGLFYIDHMYKKSNYSQNQFR